MKKIESSGRIFRMMVLGTLGAILQIIGTGCAGYQTKVGLDYTDPSGWSAGIDVTEQKLPLSGK